MQGKGVVKFFAILLAVVCLYQLSFTWVTHNVKEKAKEYAKGDQLKETLYLDSMSTIPVYPILGHTYSYCSNNALALGLDLEGGMSVTMQVSLAELVQQLSDKNPDPAFNQAIANAEKDTKNSQKDFITLFVEEYEKLNPNGKLAAIFSTKDNQEHVKFNSSNAEVETWLKDQAQTAVKQTYTVLNTRIDQFGVTSPNIQLQAGTNRILIELPGVKDEERVRKLLSGTAKLEFYKTFQNGDAQGRPGEAFGVLESINKIIASTKPATSAADTTKKSGSTVSALLGKKDTTAKAQVAVPAKKDTAAAPKGSQSLLSKVQKTAGKDTSSALGKDKFAAQNPLFSILQPNIYQDQSGQQKVAPGPVVGFADMKDTAKVDAYLHSPAVQSAIPHNMKFLWGVKPSELIKKGKYFELYAIKLDGVDNGPVLAGDVITDARPETNERGQPDVVMNMNSAGAQKWATVTREAANDPAGRQAIAIVLDDNVYSAPTVDGEIPGGTSSISGNFKIEDTQDLANVLKAGRLPARAVIVDESVVGPSLGQAAINASLLSELIGLLVVLVFMVSYYNRAGTVAVMAVIVNMFFLMGVLTGLHAVLTVPGVAGIVLTLGIAVDANVLIYERVREEMNLGKSLRIAISDGFKHALSSILDANISTFLTGLILFVFGSGPIKGFATTLMIGIVTSLFCSLLISRLIFEV